MRRLLPLLIFPLLWATPVVSYHLDTWEDGSGVAYFGGSEVHFPADTFPWNCSTQGNGICGPR